MLESLKAYIKTVPRLYDLANSVRPIRDPVERWFDDFSRSQGRRVSFIQVGASDGLRWDPIRRFVVRDRWRGVFVEPVPSSFELLKKNYSYLRTRDLVFVNAAVGASEDESLTLWSYSDEFLESLDVEDRMLLLRKASFNKNHLLKSLEAFSGDSEDKLERISVPCLSLTTLATDHFDDGVLDLVVIDAEGYDGKIIKGIDFNRVFPKAIFFESHNLGEEKSEVDELLRNHGFGVTDMGGDSLATRLG